jgi:hypothetical protein
MTRFSFRIQSVNGGADLGLEDLRVRGDLVFVTAVDAFRRQPQRSFLYRLGETAPREITGVAPAEIVDHTPNGLILVRDANGLRLITADGETRAAFTANVLPFGVNDGGTIAYLDYGPPNSNRWSIAVAGPGPGSARCFVRRSWRGTTRKP